MRVNEEEDDRAGKANDNVSLPCTCDVYVVFVPFVKVVSRWPSLPPVYPPCV